jgi:pimeloyl-ACP methyl ester carboxylesterase
MSSTISWRRKTLLRWVAGLVVLSGFALFAHCSEAPDYTRMPVLFVHGHGLHATDWDPIIAALIRAGYPKEYLSAVQITPNRMANIEAAEKFLQPASTELLRTARQAAKAAGKTGYPEKINIVSHSMGAISSRWLAARLVPEGVNIWIGLAPANHGTDALCSRQDDGAREMCPAFAPKNSDSFVQVALNGTPKEPADETPYGIGADKFSSNSIAPDESRRILYITVRIEPDMWIKPESSALLDGAGGVAFAVPDYAAETTPGNFLFLPAQVHGRPVDHENILVDERLIAFVHRLLSLDVPVNVQQYRR